MIATDEHCILTVCLADAGPTDLPLWRANSAAEALSIRRLARVDLLLIGLRLPDMSPWQFIARVRAAACAPRWALVAPELSSADEIQARSLGAIAVLDDLPTGTALDALLSRARRVTRRTSPPPALITVERIQPSTRESESCGSNS